MPYTTWDQIKAEWAREDCHHAGCRKHRQRFEAYLHRRFWWRAKIWKFTRIDIG